MLIKHQGGLTSCLTVILHEVCKFRDSYGHWPEHIDTALCFDTCKSDTHEDLSPFILRPSEQATIPALVFDHGHQYADYSTLDLAALRSLASFYAWPSTHVGNIAFNIRQQTEGRTHILFRGNDKVKETRETPYPAMFELAQEAGGPFVVLTDEREFFDEFRANFPDTMQMPGSRMVTRGVHKNITGGPDFAANFLASLFAMSQAEKIVTTTGNTGLWPFIWRGHARGTWQYLSRERKAVHTPHFPKLEPTTNEA